MIGTTSETYYHRRAEQADRLAAAATAPIVRDIHRAMAAHYRSLLDDREPHARQPLLRSAF